MDENKFAVMPPGILLPADMPWFWFQTGWSSQPPLTVYEDPDLQSALDSLRQEEVSLAVTVDEATPHLDRLSQKFDLLEIPWSVHQKKGLPKRTDTSCLLLVNWIETHDQPAQALEAGADLLQGFLSTPLHSPWFGASTRSGMPLPWWDGSV